MDINNMSAKDYLDLYCFVKLKNKQIYKDYKNFKPTLKDFEEYTEKVNQFEEAWEKDKSLIHKPISLTEQPKVVNKDNDFAYCLEVGHKFELFVEQECKRYCVDLGMYYDKRQFEGENALGLEIKHDGKVHLPQNNVYIEYEAISKDGTKYLPSGILKQDNTKYWLIGTEKEYYIFYKEDLIKIYNNLITNKKVDGCLLKERKRNNVVTSRGFTMNKEARKRIMIADNIGEFLVKVGLID